MSNDEHEVYSELNEIRRKRVPHKNPPVEKSTPGGFKTADEELEAAKARRAARELEDAKIREELKAEWKPADTSRYANCWINGPGSKTGLSYDTLPDDEPRGWGMFPDE